MQYIVRIRCTVIKEIVCEADSEADARLAPYMGIVDEIEIETLDWKILSVEENK